MTTTNHPATHGQRRDADDGGAVCLPDVQGHCVTCGDEALPARVIGLTGDGWSALVEVAGRRAEVDISLVEAVRAGDVLLVHGGVALGRAAAP